MKTLPDIIERRHTDRDDILPPAIRRQLEVGFTAILRRSLAAAERIGAPRSGRAARGLAAHQLAELREEFDRRVRLLEILVDYDYR